jgi:hypothetical protein
MDRPPAHLLRLARLSESTHPCARALRATCTLALTAALLAGGCGGDAGIDASTSDEDAGTERLDAPGLDASALEDAASSGSTRTTIGPAGGTARSADGLFEIIVPAGALTEDVELVITPVATADVPSDVAATDPISTVYSVEPDGLTFGGDGAIVHYHFDTTPGVLVRDGRFGAGFPVSRSASGGTPEWQAEPTTLHHEGIVDVLSSLAHLSYQWASARDAFGDDYFLGVVYRDDRDRGVGDRWSPVTDAQATTELGSIQFTRVAIGAVGVVGDSPLPAEPTDLEQVAWELLGVAEDTLEDNTFALPEGPFRADRPQLLPSDAMPYVCQEAGVGRLFDRVRLQRTGADDTERVYLHVEDPEPTRCFGPEGVRVSILDTIPAVREDATITTSTPPAAEARVETRGEGTRTVNLADSPWFVIEEPAGSAAPMGPDTITAVNSGATMTATRDPMTGEYASILDDPSLWDPAAITAVTFGGRPSRDVAPVPQFGTVFGPVDGLDTRLTGEGDLRLAIRIEGEVVCGAERFLDMVLFRSIVDGLPLDGPLREGLALLATHCEQTIETLTGRPFTVELSRRRSALEIMPDYTASVDVGRAITLSGQDLLRECSGRYSMFCRDRCIDPVGDPMNCGACGRVGVEVCNDMADNDCDYYVDNDCPIRIDWSGAGDSDTSAMIGDVTSASDGSLGHGCNYTTPFTGLCGSTNTDGTVRGLSAICGSVRLVPTGPDAFDVQVTEFHPGGISCEMASLSPSGGTRVAARCPAHMIADGVFGAAPSSGNLGQVGVSCSQWDVVRDPALGWVIRRVSSGVSPTIGSGPGMPFPAYMVGDHSTLGTPGGLRQLRGRYRGVAPMMMPGGVLWFSVAGSPPILTLN